MYLLFALLLLIILFYYGFSLLRVLTQLNKPKLLPETEADLKVIRKHPEVKKLESIIPTIPHQKWGLLVYAAILLLTTTLFFLTLFTDFWNWSLLIVLFVPLMQLSNLLNIFAITEDGVIVGAKFLSWQEIKGYELKQIDLNHRFYGYDSAFNDDGYEIRFHQMIFSKSGVIATADMKKRLDMLLAEKLGDTSENISK